MRSRAALWLRGPGLLVLLAACQATDPAFLTPEGRLVRDVEPIPFRIAIAPVELAAGIVLPGAADAGPRCVYDAAELQARLVGELGVQRAATEVLAVASLEEARAARADLLLRPRVSAVHFTHEGTAPGWLLSTFLWLTTWIGGAFVQDSSYDARLEIEWTLVNPFDQRDVDSVIASSEQAELEFWGRNDVFSFGLLQTIVLPPVLTGDDDEPTSRTLSELATARVAARLAAHLKTRFTRDMRDIVGELRLDSPRNGAELDLQARLRGRLIAAEPITAVHVYVNEQPLRVLASEALPPAAAQARGSTFQVALDEELPLREGSNQVAIEFAVRGRYSSRTLVVHGRGGAAARREESNE